LNERLVFSPEIVAGDPFSFGYAIRSGDALARLPRAQGLATDWRFIQRVNRIQRPQAIRAGQNIKLVTGPFHAVVHKRQFRMDVYMGDGAERVYVRSFSVGLGEYDSTPVGTFKVRPNSKLINPEWVNPRTGERFLPDDPMNPIGEHWIGLVGVSEGVRDLGGYGIHGTIEPDSIGRQASMGCIRMGAEDVALIYELLVEDHSTIEIVDQ
jgi:lipoprotein-anchoring transpeptidase ErfK/SrfK